MTRIFGNLLIIDGSFLIHRALHQPALFELRSPNGQRSGGVFQFLRSVNSEMKKNPGYFPVVCFDAGLSPRRIKVYPNYKHALDRNTEPELLTPEQADSDYLTQYRTQRGKTIEMLSYAGIPSLRFTQWEGDDLIYILSLLSKRSVILTDDKDMLQLCTDHSSVRRPMADEMVTLKSLLEDNKYEDVYDFVMNKAIIGDGSDNIPGCCKGVGGGTSINLIKILKNNNDPELLFKDETLLKDYCKMNDIKFRKAFMNFDFSQYKINLELVDLNRVEIDNYILESIISTVRNCGNLVDYFALVKNLGDLGIKDISSDDLIRNVSARLKFM